MKPVKTMKRVLVLSCQTIRALTDATLCCIGRGRPVPEVKESNQAHTACGGNCVG